MLISEIGLRNPEPPQRFSRVKRRQTGFTLLEILMVLAVIGAIIGVASLSTGLASKDKSFVNEVDHLAALMRLALDESVLSSRAMGFRVRETFEGGDAQYSYDWLILEEGQWQAMTGHSVFAAAELMPGTQLDLRLEGLAVALAEDEQGSAREEDEPDSGTPSLRERPDIFFLHSGEISPAFELDLWLSDSDRKYRLQGNPIGQLRVLKQQGEEEWL